MKFNLKSSFPVSYTKVEAVLISGVWIFVYELRQLDNDLMVAKDNLGCVLHIAPEEVQALRWKS